MYLSEFREDDPQVWGSMKASEGDLSSFQSGSFWRKRLRQRLGNRPVVWFVDDEASNREWFAKHHRRHYGVITFRTPDQLCAALEINTPCDAVVTDLFFPSEWPKTEDQADALYSVYAEMRNRKQGELHQFWEQIRHHWLLSGFDVAKDVTAIARRRRERIPVLLFSRKATILLNASDWLDESAAVENTFWLLEKLDPHVQGEPARRVAAIQRDRINTTLRYRQAEAPLWMRWVKFVGIRIGPLSFTIARPETS